MTEIKRFAEALQKEDCADIRPTLEELLNKKDEDLLVITVREFVASGLLVPGSKKAAVISGIILDHEPRRSLLANFARKLGDSSMANCYISWSDGVLAKNVHLEPEELAKEWSHLEAVKGIRRILSTV